MYDSVLRGKKLHVSSKIYSMCGWALLFKIAIRTPVLSNNIPNAVHAMAKQTQIFVNETWKREMHGTPRNMLQHIEALFQWGMKTVEVTAARVKRIYI